MLLAVVWWLWVAQLSWSLLWAELLCWGSRLDGGFCDSAGHWGRPSALPALLSRTPVPAVKGSLPAAKSVPWCTLFSSYLAAGFSVLQKPLEPCLLHPFKALPSSHFGPADCLEALVYEQVFNAFFTGIHQSGFFAYGTNVALVFFCPLLTSVIVRDVGVFPHVDFHPLLYTCVYCKPQRAVGRVPRNSVARCGAIIAGYQEENHPWAKSAPTSLLFFIYTHVAFLLLRSGSACQAFSWVLQEPVFILTKMQPWATTALNQFVPYSLNYFSSYKIL